MSMINIAPTDRDQYLRSSGKTAASFTPPLDHKSQKQDDRVDPFPTN